MRPTLPVLSAAALIVMVCSGQTAPTTAKEGSTDSLLCYADSRAYSIGSMLCWMPQYYVECVGPSGQTARSDKDPNDSIAVAHWAWRSNGDYCAGTSPWQLNSHPGPNLSPGSKPP